ncbi:MAG: DUF3990 domain-containing protein [Prevotellaceae bacterium]|jgi:hypothetical protein|nr:DUF3990 domain-containing protein [Prevotellaceae bacterium]
MKVYHGSYTEIDKIDLSKCQPNRDFGRSFYVTNLREQAEYWAERKGDKYDSEGHVTEYTFYENAFEHYGLKVLRFDGYSEEWLDFVVLNRNPRSPIPAHDYDIVEGPVANDDVAQRIHLYVKGDLPKLQFLEELKFKHHPSHQIAFCTVKSLQMLEWIDKKSELSMLNIDEAITQHLVADCYMTESKAVDAYFDSQTYQRLIDESTGFYQKPWTEILKLLLQELALKG